MSIRYPSEATLHALREGKMALRRARRNMTLPEKVRQVVQLQRIQLAIIRRRRPLRPLERVWLLDKR